jgi:hypothetical protein
MDFGSGFWDQEDANAARWAAEALGLCPNAATPSNILEHFPPCVGLWRRRKEPFIGYDGVRYRPAPSYEHVDHDKEARAHGGAPEPERWPWPEDPPCEHLNRNVARGADTAGRRWLDWVCRDCGERGREAR